MEVLLIGTVAGGLAMLLVFAVGYFLLKDRIAPVDVPHIEEPQATDHSGHRR